MIKQDIKRIFELNRWKGIKKIALIFLPGFWATLVYRAGNFITYHAWPVIKQILLIVYFPFKIIIEIFWGISISRKAQIGPGLFINHFGCIFIHNNVKIGANCILSQEVTLGVKSADPNGEAPKVGSNVRIGPGAKILGGLKIGNNAIIGANAVVVADVKDNWVVGGVPAQFIKENK